MKVEQSPPNGGPNPEEILNRGRICDISHRQFYLFIPPRLFEVVDQPENLIAKGTSKNTLDIQIIDEINRKKYLFFSLYQVSDETLRVLTYHDKIRHKGVGHSFYTNLRAIARTLGFRYITGLNNSDNLSFFTNPTDGLGRTTLSQIKIESRLEFYPDYDQLDNEARSEYDNFFTIDFLYEQDKNRFLQ